MLTHRLLQCGAAAALKCGRRSVHHSCRQRSPHIPTVVKQTGKDKRANDIFSHLLTERIICVMGPIDTSMATSVLAQLLFLQSESSTKPVQVYINSPGGAVTAGLAIYDTMQYTHNPISTWCVGQAASMGSLLLAAGTAGMRHALPDARIMVHQPSGVEEILQLKRQINGIFAKHTGKPLETIERVMERNHYMSPAEASSTTFLRSHHRRPIKWWRNKPSKRALVLEMPLPLWNKM